MTDYQPDRVHLVNVRGIEDLRLEFGRASPAGARWTVLLGPNGVGKTTILRALAWSLEPGGDVMLLARTQGIEMLRQGADEGHVTVWRNLAQVRSSVVANRPGVFTTGRVEVSTFGYGSTRGTALGGPDRDVRFRDGAFYADTLFDPNARLIHAETWLRSREFAALKSGGGREEAFYASVKATVLRLLPGIDALDVGTDTVTVRGPAVGVCALEDLADGYLSTLGWTLDLVARWAHAHPDQADGDFTSRIQSLILVDEVDLHLHPRWQRQLIPDLKQTFPAASFVVTTHNPLTVQTAGPGEVQVLSRDAQGRVTCRQIDPPPGADADDLLTGPWFGLSSTYDRDTVEKLQRHAALLLDGVPADDAERRRLERTLRERLATFADTQQDVEALERAAKSGLAGLAGKLSRLRAAGE